MYYVCINLHPIGPGGIHWSPLESYRNTWGRVKSSTEGMKDDRVLAALERPGKDSEREDDRGWTGVESSWGCSPVAHVCSSFEGSGEDVEGRECNTK